MAYHNGVLDPELESAETEQGVALDELAPGTQLEVHTRNHTYMVDYRGGGKAMISGHPDFCPTPVLVDLYGSTWGGPLLKMNFIGIGMRMEFQHPTLGGVRTSAVTEIREVKPASTSSQMRPFMG